MHINSVNVSVSDMLTYELESNKLRGGYYTPQLVADWLATWAIRSARDRVLEPSCGDGAFIAAAAARLQAHGVLPVSGASAPITGIELVPAEADTARSRGAALAKVVAGDFFQWLETARLASCDVILGNPPFIRYQNFPEPSRTRAMRFIESQGLRPNRLTNIWLPFVVAGAALLRQGGRLAMVLPAELLQVSYAAQLRQYLADSFRRITIYACNQMFFESAEQEVVLVAAEGKLAVPDATNRCDISLVETSTVTDLLRRPADTRREGSQSKFVQHESEKWLKFFLSAREIEFMRSIREHPAVCTLGQHATVDVGVVTGKNDFFVLSNREVAAFNLERFVIPLIGRSAQLPGAVLREREHRELRQAGKRVYLLHLAGHNEAHFSAGLRGLLREGERNGYHRGYKCSIRNPWYCVPAVWEPDCFLFRQIYDFPRVVLNQANATSTDTIHRMRCVGPTARVAANLYTHLTAASAEIEGRSYGGGVLELEPTEAERLLVPKRLNGALPIAEVDKLVRRGRLSDVLQENDRLVLRGSLGFSGPECAHLKAIWTKMRERRVSRRKGI